MKAPTNIPQQSLAVLADHAQYCLASDFLRMCGIEPTPSQARLIDRGLVNTGKVEMPPYGLKGIPIRVRAKIRALFGKNREERFLATAN